jgi:FecR protein
MSTQVTRFYFDWWIVQKRTIYSIIFFLSLVAIVAAAALYVWKYGNPLRNVGQTTATVAGARFVSFEGDIRVIRADTRQGIMATADTQLYPGDTVQTLANGRAKIGMADGSTVVVRPDSTIIIRDNDRPEGGKRTNVRVVVDSGQMLVRTEQQTEGTRNVVETPKTQNQITGETAASFGVSSEGTEEIRVNAGAIESVNRAGEKVSLRGGEYVSVNQSGIVSKPQRLLDVPQPIEPRDLEKVFVGTNGSATVGLHWQKPHSGSPAYYSVEVATSPFFVTEGRVIERDQLVATQFTASDLRPGSYFWRVRAAGASGQVSDWSEPQKFIITTRLATSASVSVGNLTSSYLGGNLYIIRGTASPGINLRVAAREAIAASNGAFQIQISLPPGTREVTLIAADSQGNNSEYRLPLATTESK